MAEIVGVFREAQFSPGRVDDDAAILTRVAAALTARGLDVELWSAERVVAAPEPPRSVRGVLAMCQSAAALTALDGWAERVQVINTPTAIRHCYRSETVRALAAAGVPFPRTTIVATGAPQAVDVPCWVKRGDVHAMTADDVVFAPTDDVAAGALAGFAARGIATAALQRHVEGTVVKFYGVADGSFFRAYADVAAAPAAIDALSELARAAAVALGLEIFGGDLVVPAGGSPALVDINDWPSFARCRDEAAEAIAAYTLDRFDGVTDCDARRRATAGSRRA